MYFVSSWLLEVQILLTAQRVSWNHNSFQSSLPVLFHLCGRGTLQGGIFKEQEITLLSARSVIKRPTAESHGPSGKGRWGVGGRIPTVFDGWSDILFRNWQRSLLTRAMISEALLSPTNSGFFCADPLKAQGLNSFTRCAFSASWCPCAR